MGRIGESGLVLQRSSALFHYSEDRSTGKDAYHGAGGPQHVSDVLERHPLCDLFVQGAQDLGVRGNHDYNGESQEGVSYYQRTILNGRRHSAATAFLDPIRNRANLRIITDALVERLTFEGKQVKGVVFQKNQRTEEVRAGKEILLSAGSINSPAFRSGQC